MHDSTRVAGLLAIVMAARWRESKIRVRVAVTQIQYIK
jgi:hypothetical protein